MFAGILVMATIEGVAHYIKGRGAHNRKPSTLESSSSSATVTYSNSAYGTADPAAKSTSGGGEDSVVVNNREAEQALLADNPHSSGTHAHGRRKSNSALVSLGLWTCVGISLHPEGMAVFAALSFEGEKSVGLSLLYGILLHNVPMGMSIAMPVYAGTRSWKKAMGICAVAAFAQPFGGLLAWGTMGVNLSLFFNGAMYSMISGLLLFVVVVELLPSAFEISPSRILPATFLFIGMGGMAVIQTQLGHSHHGHGHGNHTHNDTTHADGTKGFRFARAAAYAHHDWTREHN